MYIQTCNNYKKMSESEDEKKDNNENDHLIIKLQKGQKLSDFHGGKLRGSCSTKKTYCCASFRDKNKKDHYKSFSFKDYGSENEAHTAAIDWLEKGSIECELYQNRIRYISKDTIEVELGEGIFFTTDAKHLDIVNKYRMFAKKKVEKNGKIRYYPTCQYKKKALPFVKYITNYKIVEYIDGNSLNATENNLKEFGSVKTSILVEKNNKHNTEIDHLTYFNMEHIVSLPKDIWILGKPSGTIFSRTGEENIYTIRVTDDNKKTSSTTINKLDYKSKEGAYNDALCYQYNTSYKINATKNLIRIIDNEYIQVKLSKGVTMITDKIFIPLIQSIPLFVSKNGHDNAKDYCAVLINKKNYMFHNLITGFNMVDHINNNPLDNRLINLRWTNHSENNRNRITGSEHVGVIFNEQRKYYEVRGKLDGAQSYKYFYFKNDEDKKQAKLDAITYRKNFIDFNCNTTSFEFTGKETPNEIEMLLERLKIMLRNLKNVIVFDKNEYLKNIPTNDDNEEKIKCVTFTTKSKEIMFRKYITIQLWRTINLENLIKLVDLKFTNGHIKKEKIMFNNKICFRTEYSIINYDENKVFTKENEVKEVKENANNETETEINNNELTKDKISEVCDIINLKKATLVTNKKFITSKDSKIEIKCLEGHEFTLSYVDLVENMKWCEKCKLSSKNNLEVDKILIKLFKEKFNKKRPEWLTNVKGIKLELDFYSEELKLAFEYNEEHHYKYNKTYHSSQDDFEKEKFNDKIKIKKCEKNNVTLVTIPYTVKTKDIEQYIVDQLKLNNINPTNPNYILDDSSDEEKLENKNINSDTESEIGSEIDSDTDSTKDEKLVKIKKNNQHKSNQQNNEQISEPMKTREDKISESIKLFNQTEEGKEVKKRAHEKRSETMAKKASLITHKKCCRCNNNLPVEDFTKRDKNNPNSYQSNCRKCFGEIKRERKSIGKKN